MSGNRANGANGIRGRGAPRLRGNGQRHPSRPEAALGAQSAMIHHDASQSGAEGEAERDTSHLSSTRFDSLSDRISTSLLSSIPFTHMSLVQEATFEPILSGIDVLAQAKTGTGKTIAFLLPCLQKLLINPPAKTSPCNVSVLILSPTRELALQTEKEAKMLLGGMGNMLQVQHCIGGTNIKQEKQALQHSRCDLLVATPGRLLDHIQTSGLQRQLGSVRVVVLDEADRMLDMGFRNELEKIMSALPPREVQPRQSLLFSATIPPGIREVADLDPNHVIINTLKPGEENTHEHVPQEYVIVSSIDMFPATVSLLEQAFEKDPATAKVILFFPTARMTGLFYAVLQGLQSQSLDSVPVVELHSRKAQGQRVKASELFSKAERAILCSSDVTARGVDFPGVTQVIQVGLPANGEQYIHRLGRTARAGASGSGILLLTPAETFFLKSGEMRTLPIKQMEGVANMEACKARVGNALLQVSDKEKAQAYQAALGYYKGFLKSLRWTPVDLVKEMNALARDGLLFQRGVNGPAPPLLTKTVGKMGLRGTPGLNVVKEMPPWLDDDDDAPRTTKPAPERHSNGQPGSGPGRGRGRGRGAGAGAGGRAFAGEGNGSGPMRGGRRGRGGPI